MSIVNRFATSAYKRGHSTCCTSTASSNVAGRSSQGTDDTALTEARSKHDSTENQNFVSGLFSEAEIDADLRMVIEAWPQLSKDIRAAILRIAGR